MPIFWRARNPRDWIERLHRKSFCNKCTMFIFLWLFWQKSMDEIGISGKVEVFIFSEWILRMKLGIMVPSMARSNDRNIPFSLFWNLGMSECMYVWFLGDYFAICQGQRTCEHGSRFAQLAKPSQRSFDSWRNSLYLAKVIVL